jgi:hypothetical protein
VSASGDSPPTEPTSNGAEAREASPTETDAGTAADGTAAVWRSLIVRVDVWATAVFTVVSVTAAVWPGALAVALVVDLGLFLAGSVAFAWAYLRAVGRSREEEIALGGLFFLSGDVAPTPVKVWLWGALAVQVVVAVATAAARPFSGLAFGVLAPMFGLAMLAVWGAAHGRFPSRTRRPSL